MKNKGQVILLVMFLLALSGTLIGGLSIMWRNEINIRSLEKNNLLAFYIAQAGIERAKIELKSNWDWSGVSDISLGAGTYNIRVSTINPRRRNIVSSSQVKECLSEITVNIERSPTMPYTYSQMDSTWGEI